ncbi:hypothetical protein ACFLIM_15295 [Nonomuraea sp. M3C6]|uniref:Uncharacterized protein n=1 Tax=Nonomuraea marmarensis TaxID=3351344 RepID=A0ABW7AB33_9ACTN
MGGGRATLGRCRTHRRYPIDFQPFTPGDLDARLTEAGLAVAGSTYRQDRQRYAVAATNRSPLS